MTDFELREQLTGPRYHAITQYFGTMEAFDYSTEDEAGVKKLMDGINESFYSSLLYLMKFHENRIKEVLLYFFLGPEMKQWENIRNEIQKLSDSPLKKDILKLIPAVPPISNNGRPKNRDTVVIEVCSSFASYVWYYNLIPGKRSKPSKEMVYPFIHKFIKACGYTFETTDKKSIELIKDCLKKDLKGMDQQKF
jgi:hypothetical protein